MLVRSATRSGDRRRGVILMVVLALLTLFAILGLSFVFYSDAEATSARIFREAQSVGSGNDPNAITAAMTAAAWPQILGQIIYDVNDDDFGVLTVLRGHSLGRTMYGWNDAATALNDKPYNGTGRLAETSSNPLTGAAGISRQGVPNYTYYSTDGFVSDPARMLTRANTTAPRGSVVGDLNPSYSFADFNNMALAMLDPSTGQVLVPSYYRPWMPFGSWATGNPNWTNAYGKYLTMRPRPADNPGFPYPSDAMGDVKNLDFAPGGNDSFWIDFNAPVTTLSDGTQIKCMAAVLILEMDGRINVNTAGNILSNATTQGKGTVHASNQGWGPWEVSLAQVLNANNTEWLNVFNGNGSATNPIQGRYGPTGLPIGPSVPGGTLLRSYYPIDYNAVIDASPYGLSTQWALPGRSGAIPYQIFPYYPGNSAFGVATQPWVYGNANPVETPNHPAIYNPLQPGWGYNPTTGTSSNYNTNNAYNTAFSATDLGVLLQQSNTTGSSLSSNLLSLLQANLVGAGSSDQNAAARRARVTPWSFDMDRPGVTPYIYDPTVAPYTWTAANGYPTGAAIPFPTPTPTLTQTTPANSEFDPSTWRSILAGLGRIDLNRKLTNYPQPNASWMFDLTPGSASAAQYNQAVTDRQKLASDIFQVLLGVTGAGSVGTYAVGTAQYNAQRWLAQLAVNIVDFIDQDDYSTPFNWDPTNAGWVFGTELPRVVINEYYAQWDNDPLAGNLVKNGATYNAANFNRVNIWVELMNSFPTDPGDPQNGTVRLHNGTYPIYQLVCLQQASANLTKIASPDNVLGLSDNQLAGTLTTASSPQQIVSHWGNTGAGNVQPASTMIQPGYAKYNGTAGSNTNGFYVVGPQLAANQYGVTPSGATLAASNPNLVSTYQSGALTFQIPVATNPTVPGTGYRPALLLQRLANPYLPPQTDPKGLNYNPYITVDYVYRVNINSGLSANGNDGRIYGPTGALNAGAPNTLVANRQAWGRVQPLAAYFLDGSANNQWLGQNPLVPPALQPMHTFYQQNAREAPPGPPSASTPNQTLTVPFSIQYHPDRMLVSIADLLNVSGWKPHEFTQRFMDGSATPATRFGHRARWTDPSTRLLRAFEFFTLGSRMNGFAVNGRIPGKVNLNTVWDPSGASLPPIFGALTDPQAANQFTAANVMTVWNNVVNNRGASPSSSSQPFWGFGTGSWTTGDVLTSGPRGISSTLLRPAPASGTTTPADVPGMWDNSGTAPGGARLLEPPPATLPATPLRRYEMLGKMLTNLTTRSNVYGIWVTFGFFQVNQNPNGQTLLQVGPEYVWPTLGTTLRHKMFAVVDRSQLQVWPTNNNGQAMVQLQTPITLPVNNGVQATFVTTPFQLMNSSGQTIGSVTNPNTNRTWTLQAGAMLTIDPNTPNEETVVVQPGIGTIASSLNGVQIPVVQATFWKNHAKGAVVISRGNPGPWTQYDPTKDRAVVPYTASIN
jgi:hypothetical protein